jgi:hypothetical protein
VTRGTSGRRNKIVSQVQIVARGQREAQIDRHHSNFCSTSVIARDGVDRRREGYRVALSFGGRERQNSHTAGRNRSDDRCMRGLPAATGQGVMLDPRAWCRHYLLVKPVHEGVQVDGLSGSWWTLQRRGDHRRAGVCTGVVEPESE